MADVLEKTKPASKTWIEPEIVKETIKSPKKEYQIVDKARYELVEIEYKYPFDKVEIGQGFFVPLEDSGSDTLDKLVVSVSKEANLYRTQNSQIEINEEGDTVLETVTINARLRNPDGSFKLDGDGQPKLSVSTVVRPKLIGPMFTVKAVYKDDELADEVKAEKDGVLVIRLD